MNVELIDNEVPVGGTSLVGYIKTTYEEIVEVFGDPRYLGSGDDKVTSEWNLEFDVDGENVVATIYDWKLVERGVLPMRFTPFVEYDWHIGGYSTQAAHVVAEYMKRTKA